MKEELGRKEIEIKSLREELTKMKVNYRYVDETREEGECDVMMKEEIEETEEHWKIEERRCEKLRRSREERGKLERDSFNSEKRKEGVQKGENRRVGERKVGK